MLRKIRVYGRLAIELGQESFEAEVGSAAEAVRFLLANFPSLEPVLAQGYYKVSAGQYSIGDDELHHPVGKQEIKIIPVISGSGGAVGKIIAGIALIALSFVSFGSSAAFAGIASVGAKAAWGSKLLFSVGSLLALQGVTQLLTPVPQLAMTGFNSADDPRRSYSFSGVQQSSRQGIPVPIVYGRRIVGSVVASGGIDTVRVQA